MLLKDIYTNVKGKFPDIDDWDSLAIRMEFGDDAADAIICAILCADTLEPWESIRAFEKVAVVINGRSVISEVMQDICPREIGYACMVLHRDYPDDHFNDSVCMYIATVLTEWGFVIAPPSLSFVQPFLVLRKLSKPQAEIQRTYLDEVELYISIKTMEESGTKGAS